MAFRQQKERFIKSTPLSILFRFIDGLCPKTDHLEFDKNYTDIYPKTSKTLF